MEQVTIKASIKSSLNKVWDYWTSPEHIVKWNTASEDWHTTKADNDLRVGGKFMSRMEAKDGSFGFDFEGTYDEVVPHKRIAYTLDDNRKVVVTFTEKEGKTEVVETFETETENPVAMQRSGWQAILDNFKVYTEKH
ncbi:SRPBCC family protein [Kriegella aquimaris]|uniref:Uncharacterized conserved protein YndB, AHSA1/START domain n=1 Tax=Kriegella aquimaris TaxID=192904 RepID=A0A1G9SRZ3_9FLAO|nr:SRPBCC family protein [Kriegella aquimaris]SDM38171.1 Uncharacterized conserved protein YndB, AHSA1/START domain [Kriegella aquimaris]